jgi:hypothetical protein
MHVYLHFVVCLSRINVPGFVCKWYVCRDVSVEVVCALTGM